MLELQNIKYSYQPGTTILNDLNATFCPGRVYAIVGSSGCGKSTLLSAIMGHPKYKVTQGSLELDGQNVLSMEVDQRLRAGLFLGMQYPQEIPGVTNSDFLKAAMNARLVKPVSLFKFIRTLDKNIEEMKDSLVVKRNVMRFCK